MDPKRKDFDIKYSNAFDGKTAYMKCDWRNLLAYLMGDSEMKETIVDNSEKVIRYNVVSWLFKATYNGVKHKDLYVLLTDGGSDLRSGRLCGDILNNNIWASIVAGMDVYLKEKVRVNEPQEFEIRGRYLFSGVGKRESRSNELWCYSREEERRKQFDSIVHIGTIFP
jgi:hypothetical protein